METWGVVLQPMWGDSHQLGKAGFQKGMCIEACRTYDWQAETHPRWNPTHTP